MPTLPGQKGRSSLDAAPGPASQGSVPPAGTAPTTRGPEPKAQVPGVTNREGIHYQNEGEGLGQTLSQKWGHVREEPWRAGKGDTKPQLQEPGGRCGPAPACGSGQHMQPLFPETVPATQPHAGHRSGSGLAFPPHTCLCRPQSGWWPPVRLRHPRCGTALGPRAPVPARSDSLPPVTLPPAHASQWAPFSYSHRTGFAFVFSYGTITSAASVPGTPSPLTSPQDQHS